MKTQFYFPAPVEVVKVTNENLAEVAEWCGGKVASTESRRVPGRQDSYVWVPTPKGNSISWAFPGMYITKRLVVTVKDEMKATYAVFRRDYFSRNYFDTPTDAVNKTWEKQDKQKVEAAKPAPKPQKPRETYKSKAEIEADTKIVEMPDGSKVDSETGFTKADDLEVPRFRHLHNAAEVCDESVCPDRYVDGIHIFNDMRINTFEQPYPNQPHIQKENNMPEINENGVPVLTEEEAEQRAFEKELAAENEGTGAVADQSQAAPAETVAPDMDEAPVVEDTDLIGSDIAAGEEIPTEGEIGHRAPSSNEFNAGNLDD